MSMMLLYQMMEMMNEGLPSKYRQVEYIEGTGTQYIISDIPIQSPITIESTLIYTSGADSAFFCASYEIAGTDRKIRIGGNGHYSYYKQDYYNSYILQGSVSINQKYDFKFYGEEGYQEGWIDGVSVYTQNKTHNSSDLPIDGSRATFGIMCENREGNILFKSQVRLFSLVVTGQNGVIGNFIPCVRKSDSKPGLYDLVLRKFYTNAGTGEFVVPE